MPMSLGLARVQRFATALSVAALPLCAHAFQNHNIGNEPAPRDPRVTDPVVITASDFIDSADRSQRPMLIDWLVEVSATMQDQAEAQALYRAGHQNYALQRLDQSTDALEDLAKLAPGTLLEVEALRMLAQIDLASSSTNAALDKYEKALTALNKIEVIQPADRELALISFASMLATLYETQGRHAEALRTSELILDEVHMSPTLRREAMRRAGRSLIDLDDLPGAAVYYQTYLAEFPEHGWDNGVRIEAERRLRICEGMTWGLGYADEFEFCTQIIGDPNYRADPARYRIGNHFATILIKRGFRDEAEQVIIKLLTEVEFDVLDADNRGDVQKRKKLKNDAEGRTRSAYVLLLKSAGRMEEALQQLDRLRSDPEYGHYSQRTAESYGLLPRSNP